MSDPSVDLEKGITGPKKVVEEVQYKHSKVKVMCVKVLLHMYPWVFLAFAIYAVVMMHRTFNTWYSWLISLIFSLVAVFMFWKFRDIKEANILGVLGSADSDLGTTLLAESTPKGNKK